MKISNLPNNIQKHDIHFKEECKCPQFSEGPMVPNPGPILPIDEAEALNDVIISISNIENITEEKINIII